jgi:hypothetical protein
MALNTILGAGLEAGTAAADVILLPGLILAFFVAQLTPSYTAIGFVPAIAVSFWTLARLPSQLLTATRRRQQPWAFAAALVRAASIGVLALVASRTGPADLTTSARPLLSTLFLCLIVYSLAGGFGSVPTAGVLRSAIAAEDWGKFALRRKIASVAFAIIAGLVAVRLLGTTGLTFPSNYGRLFLVATVSLIAVTVFIAAMREPTLVPHSATPLTLSPRAWRQPLYDSRYNRFLVFRVLFSLGAAIDPFLFLYGVTRLDIPVTAIGGYALAGVLGWVVSVPVWRWLQYRFDARTVLQGAAVMRLVAPTLALVLPQLAATEAVRARLAEHSSMVWLYGATFVALGAALAAQSRGNYSYLVGLAPRAQFPTYAGLTNAVLAVVAFAPVLGGALIQRLGYETFFVIAAATGLVAVLASGWLVATPAVREESLSGLAGRGQRMLSPGRA